MSQPSIRRQPALPFHYAWIVAGVTFLVLIVTTGVRATPGVLMVPLESALYLPHTLQHGAAGLGMFAVFNGLDWIATVPPTVKLTSRAFGRENTGVIYGWIGASHQLGASLAAFGAGAIRSVVGGYQLACWIAGVLCVLAGTAFLTVGRRSFTVQPAVAVGVPA